MQVEAIGGGNNNDIELTQQNSLSQSDFLKLFLAQLSFQDPLEPVDNAEFLAQMAQFSAVEQSRLLNSKIDSLLSMNSIDQAVSLIGKTVEYQGIGSSATGKVFSINFSEAGPTFTIEVGNGEYIDGVHLSEIKVLTNL